MSDYTGIHMLARRNKCVIVIFDVEDVAALMRRTNKALSQEGMWWFLEAQGDTLSELLADKGLEILERELTEWADPPPCVWCKKPGCPSDHDDNYSDGGPPPEEIAGWASALNAHAKERFGDW